MFFSANWFLFQRFELRFSERAVFDQIRNGLHFFGFKPEILVLYHPLHHQITALLRALRVAHRIQGRSRFQHSNKRCCLVGSKVFCFFIEKIFGSHIDAIPVAAKAGLVAALAALTREPVYVHGAVGEQWAVALAPAELLPDWSESSEGALGLLDFSAGLTRDKWRFSLWGRNLTDERYRRQVLNSTGNAQRGIWAEPRTYGVKVGYSFGE